MIKKTNFHPEFEHTEISVYFHTEANSLEMVFPKLEIMQRYNGKLSLIFAIFFRKLQIVSTETIVVIDILCENQYNRQKILLIIRTNID